MLAVQLPGRGKRIDEAFLRSATSVAEALAPVLAYALGDGTAPYIVVCHSMGCLVAFETLMRLRVAGMRMPQKLFLSCMLAPDFETEAAPWRRNGELSDAEFREELYPSPLP